MDKALPLISFVLGIISIGSVIFYAGYNFRTLQSLRQTAHELQAWRQNLMNDLDMRFVRRDIFEEKLDNIEMKVDDIKDNMERRKSLKGVS